MGGRYEIRNVGSRQHGVRTVCGSTRTEMCHTRVFRDSLLGFGGAVVVREEETDEVSKGALQRGIGHGHFHSNFLHNLDSKLCQGPDICIDRSAVCVLDS